MNKELEEAKTNLKELGKIYYKKGSIKIEILSGAKYILAIETVLKELERLQEENNKLERANKTYINSMCQLRHQKNLP